MDNMTPVTNLTGRLGNQMFQYAYMYSQMRDGEIPDIYVQNEEYFKKYKHEIKTIFSDGIGKLPYVAIHVRRGDYVNNSFYVDLYQEGYYVRAMKEFEGANFLVFSDDIPWCKEQYIFRDCHFSTGYNEVQDLNQMASCRGHIIANSSFSWWGAYLSPHSGRVVAPKNWYSDGVERTALPASWLRI